LVDGLTFDAFESGVERRSGGEPLQYILGSQEFFGLAFTVGPEVLIPRPETELIVEQAVARLHAGDRVCDVGVGSGAIAVALAVQRPDVRVFAADISATALFTAQRNARLHSANVRFCHADLLTAFGRGVFDAVVSNPPYVAERARGTLQRELAHEPEEALFSGPDGLDCYRRLVPQAAIALKPGGLLLLELGSDSLPGVSALLDQKTWTAPETHQDLAGIPRVHAVRRRAS
jgi:release factor glutamine methyltransferase